MHLCINYYTYTHIRTYCTCILKYVKWDLIFFFYLKYVSNESRSKGFDCEIHIQCMSIIDGALNPISIPPTHPPSHPLDHPPNNPCPSNACIHADTMLFRIFFLHFTRASIRSSPYPLFLPVFGSSWRLKLRFEGWVSEQGRLLFSSQKPMRNEIRFISGVGPVAANPQISY